MSLAEPPICCYDRGRERERERATEREREREREGESNRDRERHTGLPLKLIRGKEEMIH